MATITLAQALDNANAGQPIAAPVCAKVRASMAHAAITLARHSALKATKRQLAAQGLKVNHFSRRDLVAHAETYFADHRETLIAEAREVVAQWEAKGYFGRRSKLNTDALAGKA
jgi:hypothetical protein